MPRKIYPLKKKLKNGRSGPPPKDDRSDDDEDSDEEERPKKKKVLAPRGSAKKKKQYVEEEVDEDEDEDEDEDDDDDEDEDAEDNEDDDRNFNIILRGGFGGGSAVCGGTGGSTIEEEYYDAVDDDENEECDSEDEQVFMKESYVKIPCPEKVDSKKKRVEDVDDDDDEEEEDSDEEDKIDVESEYKELVDLKTLLALKLAKKPSSIMLQKAVEECNASIRKLVKKARSKNAKTYYTLVQDGSQQDMGEIQYFKKQMSHKEQTRAMDKLREINEHMLIKKPYRLLLLESDIPSKYKAAVMQKVNVLKSMDPSNSEYYKLKTWVDSFMRVPFGVYKNLSVNITDGIDKCHEFMERAKTVLDTCVYGLDDAKMQIMQMVGQWITNPSAMGTAIAIKGPPGTGKTSLVKEGISKILGREFAFIALGGTGDASFLEGHSYTYEGSLWGKIAQILMDSKCMNPVIYFDELDKVSDTARGEEIVGILTHLTDTSQNSQFHDKYFAEIDFDLSKCLFIFSYTTEAKVNPILRDRMYRIETKGYDSKQKMIIARQFLLPKIREQVCFGQDDVVIPDETLQYIISSEYLTHKEEGVRNLKRCLEIIHTKLNLFRLMKPETNLFSKELDIEVKFPITVTVKLIESFIKNEEKSNVSLLSMYC